MKIKCRGCKHEKECKITFPACVACEDRDLYQEATRRNGIMPEDDLRGKCAICLEPCEDDYCQRCRERYSKKTIIALKYDIVGMRGQINRRPQNTHRVYTIVSSKNKATCEYCGAEIPAGKDSVRRSVGGKVRHKFACCSCAKGDKKRDIVIYNRQRRGINYQHSKVKKTRGLDWESLTLPGYKNDKEMILDHLEKSSWVATHVAKKLGVSVRALANRCRIHGIVLGLANPKSKVGSARQKILAIPKPQRDAMTGTEIANVTMVSRCYVSHLRVRGLI